MQLLLVLCVAAGGLLGAPARLLADRVVADRVESDFPLGTYLVNVSGAFLLGLLTGVGLAHHVPATVTALLGTGFCGAYTTFSTMQVEILKIIDAHRYGLATGYAVASVAAGYAAIWTASAIVRRTRMIA